jgi:predicted O-methyltransferase YrrM
MVFEWGGGGSTIYFNLAGCDVKTVESSEFWMKEIEQALPKSHLKSNVQIELIPVDQNSPEQKQKYIKAVHNCAPYDIIVVDGLEENYISRVDCVLEAREALNPGGILILDDSWREQYKSIPKILNGWQRKIFRGLGPARPGVTQTDIYFHPIK